MKTLNKTPKFNFVVTHNFNDKDIKELEEYAKIGNIQAKLDLIMHNQLIINHKLNKILK